MQGKRFFIQFSKTCFLVLLMLSFCLAFLSSNTYAETEYVITAETNSAATPMAVNYGYDACASNLPIFVNLRYLERTNSLEASQPYRGSWASVSNYCNDGTVYEYNRVAIEPYAAMFYLHPPLPLSDNVYNLYARGSSISVPYISLDNVNNRLPADSPYKVNQKIEAGKVYKLEMTYNAGSFNVARHNSIDNAAVFSTSNFTIDGTNVYTKGTYSSTRAVAYLVVPHSAFVSDWSKINAVQFRNTDTSNTISNFDAVLSTNPTTNHGYVALPGTSPFKFPTPTLAIDRMVLTVYDYDEFDFAAMGEEIEDINKETIEQIEASEKAIKNAQEGDGFSLSQYEDFWSLSFINPFVTIFSWFPSSNCVDIPIIASMVHSSNQTFCAWFHPSIRSIVTPVVGIFASMLLVGFFVRWFLYGSAFENLGRYARQ